MRRDSFLVLVRALWREGKIEGAVEAVRDMEQKGVIGSGSVYYELACCLCTNGRWRDAMLEASSLISLLLRVTCEINFLHYAFFAGGEDEKT